MTHCERKEERVRRFEHGDLRINDQWRIIFLWTNDGPERVAIVDYH